MPKIWQILSRFRCSSLESGLKRVEWYSRGAVKRAGRDCETHLTSLFIKYGSGSTFEKCLVVTCIAGGSAARAAAIVLPKNFGWSSTMRLASACANLGSTLYGTSSMRQPGRGRRKAAKETIEKVVDCIGREGRLPQRFGPRPDWLL